ncbi:MAG TPA: GWxTD domain-containing protein [Thermoanaerobaculia bacterium]|nr:GWxTD domain-containing protein [Thermoanaerobaculia bacterium]
MKIRFAIAVLLTAFLATGSFAALSKQYADFAKGPAQYLLTKQEQKQWASIATDAQAQQFIDLFWARRDPTPATPENEFRAMFDERVKIADLQFGQAKTVGSATDRGKVFILLGSPTRQSRQGMPGQGTIQTPARGLDSGSLGSSQSVQDYSPKILWVYEQGKMTLPLGQPVVEVGFVDQYASNEWKMERVLRTDYATVFDRIAQAYVTQPALTEVPSFTTGSAPVRGASTTSTPAPAITISTGLAAAFKNEALRAAVDEARAAKAAPNTLYLTYGEFVTAEGELFVPVQLYVPRTAGLAADTEVTFFGSVDREDGSRVLVVEEPVKLAASGDAVYHARTLNVGPGSYTATFGLAKDGKPISVVSKPMTVRGLDKSSPGVSPLMLSNNIYALTQAQQPTDPFAFGGLKVVPKGDLTFRQSEDLWYFFEVRNPGIDTATNTPSYTMRLSITGTTTDGKPVKMLGPVEPVQMQELKGVAGHWAVGQALPLATFKPGEYKIALKLNDTKLNQSYDLEETFRVVP